MGAKVCKQDKLNGGGASAATAATSATTTNNGRSSNTGSAYRTHQKIEGELKRKRREEKRVIKILLLGSGDSGKSTIAKQMRILYSSGFSAVELFNYRYMIHTNFIITYHHIVRGIYHCQISVPDGEKSLLDQFLNAYTAFLDYDDEDQVKIIRKVSSLSCVAEAIHRIHEFYVPDNTAYLLSEAKRILQSNYQPTPTDVIHARAFTTGVYEIIFAMKKFNIRLIDVGGQRTERRKWIHCFDKVTAILFVFSLSCYDQYLEDDPQKNRMDDSVELFKSIYANEHLRLASLIIFANKRDLFKRKIKYSALRNYYAEYQGANEFTPALEFMQNLFLKCHDTNGRSVYSHVTNATDTKNIDAVFGASCDIILQRNLLRSATA